MEQPRARSSFAQWPQERAGGVIRLFGRRSDLFAHRHCIVAISWRESKFRKQNATRCTGHDTLPSNNSCSLHGASRLRSALGRLDRLERVDCSSSSDSTERPLIDAQLPSTCERPVYIVDPSLITGDRAAVPEPVAASRALDSGHSRTSL
jgi:hypothetical protein